MMLIPFISPLEMASSIFPQSIAVNLLPKARTKIKWFFYYLKNNLNIFILIIVTIAVEKENTHIRTERGSVVEHQSSCGEVQISRKIKFRAQPASSKHYINGAVLRLVVQRSRAHCISYAVIIQIRRHDTGTKLSKITISDYKPQYSLKKSENRSG